MSDPYRQRLEQQLVRLRARRVGLRRYLEWFAAGHMLGGFSETMQLVRQAQSQLRDTDLEWAELCHKLDRRDLLPHKSISLALSPADRRALARQATVRKSAAPMPSSFRTGDDWLRYCREVRR
jgi:transposase